MSLNHHELSAANPAAPRLQGRRLNDGYSILLITLLALLARLPYWQTVPPAGDEVDQLIYAMRISNGREFPLVGNDTYAGPFFFYLLALILRLRLADALAGRAVVLMFGVLTVPLAYLWLRRLGGNQQASLIAAGLVAANPHLIVVNSHLGGTSYIVPFFTTASLWLLSGSVELDHPGWLIAAAVAAGLALQANPISVLLVGGAWTWMALRARRSRRLGWRWPAWPLVGALCIGLVYSPVIVYNLGSRLNSLEALGERTYLWEAHPTPLTFLDNERRLLLQFTRQTSGVLMGYEDLRTIIGPPLLYLGWLAAGLVYASRKVSLLPLAAVLPTVLFLPYVSSHYGLVDPVRFTTQLTPAFAAGMGLVLAWGIERLGTILSPARGRLLLGVNLVAVALILYPLVPLAQYYVHIDRNDLSGRTLLDLSRQMVAANRGEPVYISFSQPLMSGIPYVPEANLILADVHQEFLPADQVIGRLFESPGPATLLLDDRAAAEIERVAGLTRWPGAANERARRQGYGVYRLDTTAPLKKPGFVLTGARARAAAPQVPVGVAVGDGLELIGYDAPQAVAAGGTLSLAFYWRVTGRMPEGRYIGFVHVFDQATQTLIAQDDHLLGQSQYPVNAWQPDEVVVDHYNLLVAAGVAPGRYALRTGVYTWPDSVRLHVPGHPDDLIELGPITVNP